MSLANPSPGADSLVDGAALVAEDVTVEYGKPGRRRGPAPPGLLAVDHVSFTLAPGECLSVIGESGSGKSTLAYAVANLLPRAGHMTGGRVLLPGLGDVAGLSERDWAKIWGTRIGMVFQGAQSMFNPLMTIDRQFRDVFLAHRIDVDEGMEEARRLFRHVRLDPERVLGLYPHEMSGGMRQRTAIVAGVMLHPSVLILDEPTTALDMVSQAQVLNILREIQERYGLSMMFITHDFAVASNIGHRLAVMYAGEVVEVGPTAEVYAHPRHPYTRGLIHAVPSLSEEGQELVGIPGQAPDMRKVPPGCRFADRCSAVVPACRTAPPPLEAVDDGRAVACFRWRELSEEGA
jgi:peptide/nickel transport system ATP-binding protein